MEPPVVRGRRLSLDAMNALRRIEALRQAASTDVQTIIGRINSGNLASFRSNIERSPVRAPTVTDALDLGQTASSYFRSSPRDDRYSSVNDSAQIHAAAVDELLENLRRARSITPVREESARLPEVPLYEQLEQQLQNAEDKDDMSIRTDTTGPVAQYESDEDKRQITFQHAPFQSPSVGAPLAKRATSASAVKDAKAKHEIRLKLQEEASLAKRRAAAWTEAAMQARSKIVRKQSPGGPQRVKPTENVATSSPTTRFTPQKLNTTQYQAELRKDEQTFPPDDQEDIQVPPGRALQRLLCVVAGTAKLDAFLVKRAALKRAKAFYNWREWVKTDAAVEATMKLYSAILQPPVAAQSSTQELKPVDAQQAPKRSESKPRMANKPRSNVVKPTRKLSPADLSARPVAMDQLPTGKRVPRVDVIDHANAQHAESLLGPHVAVVRVEKQPSKVDLSATIPTVTVGDMSAVGPITFRDTDSVNEESRFQLTRTVSPTSALRVKALDTLGRPVKANYSSTEYWRQVQKTAGIQLNQKRALSNSSRSTSKRNSGKTPENAVVPPPPPVSIRNSHAAASEYVMSLLTEQQSPLDRGSVLLNVLHAPEKSGALPVVVASRVATDSTNSNVMVEEVLSAPCGSTDNHPVSTSTLTAKRREELGLPQSKRVYAPSPKLTPNETFVTSVRADQKAAGTDNSAIPVSVKDSITAIEPRDRTALWSHDTEQFRTTSDGRHIYVVHEGVVNTSSINSMRSPSVLGSPSSSAMSLSASMPSSPMIGARVTEKTVMHDERKIGSVVIRDVRHEATAVDTFGVHA